MKFVRKVQRLKEIKTLHASFWLSLEDFVYYKNVNFKVKIVKLKN